MLFCGLANMTSNTRQIFAFSRDGAMPGSRWWHSVSPRTRTPVKAVWLAAACPLVLVLPGWWSHTAFTAIVSVNVVGLFLAYGVPIFLRLRLERLPARAVEPRAAAAGPSRRSPWPGS